jgi:hypothetical protein
VFAAAVAGNDDDDDDDDDVDHVRVGKVEGVVVSG